MINNNSKEFNKKLSIFDNVYDPLMSNNVSFSNEVYNLLMKNASIIDSSSIESVEKKDEILSNSKKVDTSPPYKNNIIQSNNDKTKTKTTYDKNIENKEKKQLFTTKKVNKNLGRKIKRKMDLATSPITDKTHTKYKDDNIRTKVVRKIYKHSLNYTNDELKSSENNVLNKLYLLKNDSSIFVLHQKNENINLLKMKLKEIFSNKLSEKFKVIDKDHNINTLQKIFHENDKKINFVLNLTLEDILKVYVGKSNILENFPKIDDDIEIFKQKGDDDKYIENYKDIAENLKDSFNSIIERPNRKKK